ncbi:RloB family protein [Sutterella sp.]|uniref:RloB family protein n=1 Tax=Sutterella sp. TaxID=1981025 RepID=UPI0026DEFB72|nr:RloB family protein [Sutterella sp.]MDO5532433.1 RloB family protein [Sutterella sp.]
MQKLPAELIRPYGTTSESRVLVLVPGARRAAVSYIQRLCGITGIPGDRLLTVRIVERGSPAELVSRAAEELAYGAFKRRRGEQGCTEVWIAFDCGSRKYLNAAIRAAKPFPDIHLVPSAPCFEYWLLAHYEAGDVPVTDAGSAIRALGKLVPGLTEETGFNPQEMGLPAVRRAMRRHWPVTASGGSTGTFTLMPELLVRLAQLQAGKTRRDALERFRILDLETLNCAPDAPDAQGSLFDGEPPAVLMPGGRKKKKKKKSAAAASATAAGAPAPDSSSST